MTGGMTTKATTAPECILPTRQSRAAQHGTWAAISGSTMSISISGLSRRSEPSLIQPRMDGFPLHRLPSVRTSFHSRTHCRNHRQQAATQATRRTSYLQEIQRRGRTKQTDHWIQAEPQRQQCRHSFLSSTFRNPIRDQPYGRQFRHRRIGDKGHHHQEYMRQRKLSVHDSINICVDSGLRRQE